MCQCRLCRCWTCRSQYEVGQCRCRNTTCQCVSACWVRSSHCSRTARRVRTTKQLSASLVTLHSCKPALSQNNCSVERETQPCCDYRCDTTPSDRLTAVFDSFLCSMQEWHVHTKVWYTRHTTKSNSTWLILSNSTESTECRKDVRHSSGKNHPLSTVATELNMFNFGDSVDHNKLLNSTLSAVCTDGSMSSDWIITRLINIHSCQFNK